MAKNPTTPRTRMTRPKSVQLIKGTFSLDEARHLLLSLITYKIGFHELKNFGDVERFGRTARHAGKRIDELKRSRNTLLRFMEASDATSVRLRIDATVKIRVVK